MAALHERLSTSATMRARVTDDTYLSDEYLSSLGISSVPDRLLALHKEPATPAVSRFRVYSDTDVESLPPLEYLVPDILPKAAVAELHGGPGSGKSFLAMDLAFAHQTRGMWLGHQVEKGQVLYIAAEGSAGIRQRVMAWKAARGFDGRPLGAAFILETVSLLAVADVVHLMLAARALPAVPTLIIIDTLARSMPGGDENDTADMSLLIDMADRLRKELGATVLLVHHTRKDSDQERGNTALRGGVDTMMLLKEEDGRRTLTCEKQKDAPAFSPIAFDLLTVLDSCVIQLQGPEADPEKDQSDKMTPNRRAALLALRQGFTERGATTTEWMKATDLKERTFYRLRAWLVEHEYVEEKSAGVGCRYTLTPTGKYVASEHYIRNKI